MSNRSVFFILGIVIIAIALAGFYFFQQYEKQQVEIKKLEALAETERQKALQAEEARKEQEQRKLAEERRRQAESERIRRLERERQIEEERQKEAERIRREKAAEAERRRLAEEERQRQERLRKQQEAELERKRAALKRAANTIKIRLKINPNDSKEVAVALVHKGDRVKIEINRFGGADYRLFAGLLPMRLFNSLRSRSTRSQSRRMEIMYYATGPDGAPTLVTMPIKDREVFTISDEVNALHPKRIRADTGKDGNVLLIGTGLREGSIITDLFQSRKGGFDVLIEIYANNRWDIKARSLL